MGLQKRLNKWLSRFQKYLMFYKDGYFELPYLSNTPALMVESLKKVPFAKHDPKARTISTKSIFSEGVLFYREIAEGLWILVTEITFKKPLSTRALKDEEGCDYYFLNHFRYTSKTEGIRINNLAIPKEGWSFYKPGTEINSYFNSNDSGVFINIAFSEEWFKRNLEFSADKELHSFKKFIDSKNTFKTWKDILPEGNALTQQLLKVLKEDDASGLNTIQLNIISLQLIAGFLKKASKITYSSHILASEADRRMVAKAERLILNSANQFPGIEEIARQVNTSATKLKASFKATYGVSLFQYYQQKQMSVAKALLSSGEKSVKEVALDLGYDNASNFRAAFRKHFGYNPSHLHEKPEA